MSTRRSFLQQSALALGGLHASRLFAADSGVVVKTQLGSLAGERRGAVDVFRGIPFAQPPVGPLRFRAPLRLSPWSEVRDATQFASAAMQPGESPTGKSEDCLYLNVWAPSGEGKPAAGYPVFVWIHGGGFTGGRSSDPLQDGAHFAANGVVCITLAYRLGVFGFLDMEPLLGAAYAGSANNGMRDVVAALAWVQENVAAFGGDPKRVTVGGESAGAKLTDLLMGVPTAAPLFGQMISESGGAERIATREQALEVARGFSAAWTTKTNSPASSVLSAPAEQLILIQEQFTHDWPGHFPLRCEVDENLFPQRALASIRAGSARGKRLLIGTNRDESALFVGPHPAHDATAHDLGNISLTQFETVDEEYKKLDPEMPAPLRRIRSLTAEEYLVPSMRVAEAQAANGGETFVYRFDYPGEGRFAGLAFHSYDLRFVWDHFGQATPTDDARELAASIHQAWVSFLQGKSPSGPGLPAWPAYTSKGQETMIFDHPSRVEAHPEAAELALWNGLLGN